MKFMQIIWKNGATAIDKIDNSGIHTKLAKAENEDAVYFMLSPENQKSFDNSELYKIEQFPGCWIWWYKIIEE